MGLRYIVDGQQRLTTITLLLIYLHHQLRDDDDIQNCRSYIYSSKGGKKSFNLNVPEREKCLDGLLNGANYTVSDSDSLSVERLVARYEDIDELFTESLEDVNLPYFFDWLTENVDLV